MKIPQPSDPVEPIPQAIPTDIDGMVFCLVNMYRVLKSNECPALRKHRAKVLARGQPDRFAGFVLDLSGCFVKAAYRAISHRAAWHWRGLSASISLRPRDKLAGQQPSAATSRAA